MKARRVKGLDPAGATADNLERICRVRLDELCALAPGAVDPDQREAQHDLRIAAKRLRYLLELSAFCFGPYAARAAVIAKELQDVLGEIHDCDVMLPRVEHHAAELRARDVAAVRARAGDEADDLAPALSARAPSRAAYRGLEILSIHLEARRALLHARFVAVWEELGRKGFRARLEWALAERPDPEPGGPAPTAEPTAEAEAAEPPGEATEPTAETTA